MVRPLSFTQEIADTICERLSIGESLRAICRDDGMPGRTTVLRWLADNEVFRGQYAYACEVRQDDIFDELFDISDNSGEDVNRDRLRIDTRKWVLARMAPKKYGDKAAVELTGKDEGPLEFRDVTDATRARALAAFIAKTKAKTEN